MKATNLKIKKQLKSVVGILSILFVVGLILFANCNFRQSLQTHLGVAHTKSLNGVKAPLVINKVCQSPGDYYSFNITEFKKLSAGLLLVGHHSPLELPEATVFSTPFAPEKGSFSKIIPLYILYKTMKVFM